MSPVDTEKQEGPSARTVSALVDDAAERIAAAGIETPREDAEAIVADALGVEPRELSVDSADDVSGGGRRATIEEQGEAPGRPRAARLHPRPRAASATSRSPSTSACCGRAARPSCWSRSARAAARAPASTRSAPAPARSPLALLSERPDLVITASDLSPEAAEAARENAERLGLDLDVQGRQGPARTTSASVDMVIANLPYVTDDDHLRALAGDPARAADRGHRRLRRGRPRRDPRADRGNALGDADGDGARHPPRPGDAGTAARRGNPSRLRGQRAGQRRHGAVTEERARRRRGRPTRPRRDGRPLRRSPSEAKRRAKVERLRAEGIDPYPHSFLPRDHAADIHRRARPGGAGGGRARRSSPTG